MTTVLPAWKKELIEKKKRKEKEEKQKLQEESARIERIPEWKRTLIQKRGSQSNLLAGGVQQSSNNQNISNGSVVHPKPWSPSSSFTHSGGSRYVIESAPTSEMPHSSIRSQEKVAPKESTNNREKNSLVTTSIASSVDSSSLNNHEKPVITNVPAAEENVFGLRKVGYGKSNGSIVNGLNHTDTKMDCQAREGSAICSDKVKYEHVRPPSELRKMFEKPKSQIVSGGDRSGKSNGPNERIPNTKGKNNKETVSFKSGDVDRPAAQIDQNRFEGSTDSSKLVEQKEPNSLQHSPKDSKQSENDFRTSANIGSVTTPSETHDNKISEKSKRASTLSTNVVTSSSVKTNTKPYPGHFAPKPYKAFSSSSRLPWIKSNLEVDKSKHVGCAKSPTSVSADLNSTVVFGTCQSESEIGGNTNGVSTFHSTQGHSTQPTKSSENQDCREKQNSTNSVVSQLAKSSGTALSGSDGFKQKFIIESKTEHYVTSQDEILPQAKEKLKDSTKHSGFESHHSKVDHGSHSKNDTTMSQPVRDSGKIQSRPPPIHKRWSADVATMLSLQDQKGEPARHRSPSLGDISEENTDWSRLFRHRPSISEGIERRMSELKRQVSHTEDDENQEENFIQSKQVELIENSERKQQKSVRARPSSWAAPSDVIFQSGEVQNIDDVHHSLKEKIVSDKTVPFAHKPVGQSIERRVGELVRHSSTPDILAALKDSEKQALNSVEPSPVTDEEIQSDIFGKVEEKSSNKAPVNGEAEEKVVNEAIVKPSKGSVHKLSALFGSSVFRGNKKEKLKTESKSGTLSSQRIEKPEKVNKTQILAQSKEEVKSSPSLLKKVFKNENKPKKVENSAKEVEDKAQLSKLLTSDKVDIKEQSSINRESGEPVSKHWPSNELRHVQTQEKKKVEKKLAGKLVLMVDEDADDMQPRYHQQSDSESKKSIHTRVIDFEKQDDKTSHQSVTRQGEKQNLNKDKLAKPNTFLSMNGVVGPKYSSFGLQSTSHSTQPVSSSENPKSAQSDVSISVIDMPEQCNSDVEVSVIDVPRSPTPLDVEVSAIDLPEAPEVSVIDMPGPEESKAASNSPHQLHVYDISDGSDDSDSDDETSGSYDVTNDDEDSQPFIITEGKSFGDDEDDGISLSSTYDTFSLKAPVVVFDVAPPSNLKSCISPIPGRKKSRPKRKISFQDNHTFHHYLSEDAMTAEFEQMELRKANESKMTLSSYQPVSSTNYEKSLNERRYQENTQNNPKREDTVLKLNPAPKVETRQTAGDRPEEVTEITYKDDGYGFTESSDNAGALLF